VGELLSINFESGTLYATLAGFILAELGKIPEAGDAVFYEGYLFVVAEMQRFRIQMVRIQQMDPELEEEAAQINDD
jgi:CBS domain containing-hemolysin-like protein